MQAHGVSADYGTSQVLRDVDFAVHAGETIGLMGRNGMGKTTLLRTLLGLLPVQAGSVLLDGIGRCTVAGIPPSAVRYRGGAGKSRHLRQPVGDGESAPCHAARAWCEPRVLALFPRLQERHRHRGNQLSGGEQQMLAIGRALMTNPRLLVLDEATEGLAPLVRDEIWHTIRLVRESGIAVVVVDKTVSAVLSLADRITVLVKGGVVYSGSPQVLREDAELMHRHLGV